MPSGWKAWNYTAFKLILQKKKRKRDRARWTSLKFYRTTIIRINTSCHTMKTTENLITQCFQLRNSKDSPAHGQ